METPNRSRRNLLLLSGILPPMSAFGETKSKQDFLEPTAACPANAAKTPRQTSGPFFTPSTPLRNDFRADDPDGELFQLVGFIKTRDCQTVSNALVELWHADSAGRYDNEGYRLRGHQFSDEKGRFIFHTVVPGHYPGRTQHFHVTVQPEKGRALTTQLYFPGNNKNKRDGIFDSRLLMDIREYDGIQTGRYDFVLNNS